MKDITRYQGVIPAFYACYDDNGQISPERVEEYTRFLVRKGVKGVYVGGSSGECIYQSVADRKLLLEPMLPATIRQTAQSWPAMQKAWVLTQLLPSRLFISACRSMQLQNIGMISLPPPLKRISLSTTFLSLQALP